MAPRAPLLPVLVFSNDTPSGFSIKSKSLGVKFEGDDTALEVLAVAGSKQDESRAFVIRLGFGFIPIGNHLTVEIDADAIRPD